MAAGLPPCYRGPACSHAALSPPEDGRWVASDRFPDTRQGQSVQQGHVTQASSMRSFPLLVSIKHLLSSLSAVWNGLDLCHKWL